MKCILGILLLLTTIEIQAGFLQDLLSYYGQVREARNSPDITGQYWAYRASLRRDPGPGLDAVPICGGCPAAYNLTNEVNRILRHMVEQDPDGQQDNLQEEVGRLEAMYYIARDAETNGSVSCQRVRLPGNILGQEWNFDEGDAELVFSRQMNLGRLGAIHMSNGENRTYYYRGRPPNRNLIVKVQVSASGQATVSYYRLNVAPIPSAPSGGPSTHTVGQITSINNTTDANNYFRGQYGFGIKMKNGLPEDLLILNIDGSVEISEDLKLKGQVLATARETFARLGLSDMEDNEYVYLSFDRNGELRAAVPFHIGRGPSNNANGEVAVSTKGVSTSIDTTIGGVNVGTFFSEFLYSGNRVSVGHQASIADNVQLSLRFDHQPYQDTDLKENVFWVRLQGTW